MQSVRLKRSGVARHLLEARDFSRVRLHEALFDIVCLNDNEYQVIRFGAGEDNSLKLFVNN